MRSHSRYMLLSLILPLLFLTLCFALPMTPYYLKISGYFWDSVVAQRFSLQDKKADVVFVGDSSLVHGVRPIEVERVSGLSGINLGIPVDALVLVPFMALDGYLAHNAPPRIVVLNITPWSAGYQLGTTNCDRNFPWYSSAVMVLRYGAYTEFANFFLSCPSRLLHLPLLIAKRIPSFDLRGSWYKARIKPLEAEDGYFPFDRNNPQTMKNRDCPSLGISPRFAYFLEEFKRRYETQKTKVILYLNPIPANLCNVDKFRRDFIGLSDNVIFGMDESYFTDYLHLGDRGALINSEILGNFLKTLK